jgi:hypothetical protein
LTLFLSLDAFGDQTVRLVAERAVAHVRDDDSVFGNEQDFFVRTFLDNQLLGAESEIAHGRDIATWNGPNGGLSNEVVVPDFQRVVPFDIQLWDYDTIRENDQFDIRPGAGRMLSGTYDTCAMRAKITSTGEVLPPGAIRVSGDEAPSADFTFRVDGLTSSAPDDVAIRRVALVQSVEDPAFIVEGKETALLVELVNNLALRLL